MNLIGAQFDPNFFDDLKVLVTHHGPKKAVEVLQFDAVHPSFARAAVKRVARNLGMIKRTK